MMPRRPNLQEYLSKLSNAVFSWGLSIAAESVTRIEFREVRWTSLPSRSPTQPGTALQYMKDYYIGQSIRNSKPQVNITGQRCIVSHKLDDGYWLMEFPEIKIWNIKQQKKLPLRWYIHKDDLLQLDKKNERTKI